MSTVEEYVQHMTTEQKAEFARIKAIVKQLAPDVVEVISYGIPTFKYKGTYLLYFGAFKNHMSVFPGAAMTQELTKQLQDYKIAKGTIQFTAEKPLPESLLKQIVSNRLAQIAKG